MKVSTGECLSCFGSYQDAFGNRSSLELPLKKIKYQVEIVNGAVTVEISQTFVNSGDKFLQILYKIPISSNSSIHRFTAVFGGVRMEGMVKEKAEARVEYREAVQAGKRAALAQTEGKDVLSLQLGNLGPGQSVTVELVYTEEMALCLNTFYHFTLPQRNLPALFTFLLRDDLSRAFRQPAQLKEGEFEWDFRLRLHTDRKVAAFHSLSHQLVLEKANDQNTELQLTLAAGETLQKEFSFIFTTQDFELPSYTLGRIDAGSSVMVSFIPKFCPLSLEDAQAAAMQALDYETDMDAVRGQYVFLLDRSGSMGGKAIEKAKEALILFLKSLPIDTYFQVVSFGDTSQTLFNESRKNSNESITFAISSIQKMGANLGGTEIYNPLASILKSKIIEGYPKQIFLLTDGAVSNTHKVIELVKNNVKLSRVHTIGIGSSVSRELVLECAARGKGQAIFIGNGEEPAAKVIQLLNDSLTPVISGVELLFDSAVVESVVPNPARLPYILKGEVASFFLTFRGQLAQPTSIALAYTDSRNRLPFKSAVTVLPDTPSHPFVDTLANFRRIRALEDAEDDPSSNTQDYLYFVKVANKKQQIIDLSLRHQVVSRHTAFLCVEKQLIDGKYQEIKDKGTQRVQIIDKVVPPPQKSSLFDLNSRSYPSSSSYGQPYPPPPPGFSLFSSPPPPPSLSIPHYPIPMSLTSNNQPSFINFFGSSQQSYLPSPSTPMMPHPLANPVIQQNNRFCSMPTTTTTQQNKTFNSLFGLGGGSSSPAVNDNQLFKKKAEEGTVPQPAKQVAKRSLFDDEQEEESQIFSKPKPSVAHKPTDDFMDFFGGSLPSSEPFPSINLPPPPTFNLPLPPPLPKPQQISQASAPFSKTSNQDLLELDFGVLYEPAEEKDFFNFPLDTNKMVPLFYLPQQQLVVPPSPPPINSIPPPPLFNFPPSSPPLNSSQLKALLLQPPAKLACVTKPSAKGDNDDFLFRKNIVSENAVLPKQISPSITKLIQSIVAEQQFDGCWSSQKLIKDLYGAAAAEQVAGCSQKSVAVTLLVVRWLEKNGSQKEYALIIKKALSWLKKQEKHQSYSKLLEKYLQ